MLKKIINKEKLNTPEPTKCPYSDKTKALKDLMMFLQRNKNSNKTKKN